MSNYRSAVGRIDRAATSNDLSRAWEGFVRVYKTGHLTEKELTKLDIKILNKLISMGI